MNKRAEVVTIGGLSSKVTTSETAFNASRVLADTARHNLLDAKRSNAKDPCEFNAAKVQKAEQEFAEATTERDLCKERLRVSRESLRVFCYRKKSLNGKGQLVAR